MTSVRALLRYRGSLTTVAVVGLLLGCGSSSSSGERTPQKPSGARITMRMAAPRGVALTSVAYWSARSSLVVDYQPGLSPSRHQLYLVNLKRRLFLLLPLPKQSGCDFTSHGAAVGLPDRSLGYVQACWGIAVDSAAARTIWHATNSGRTFAQLVPYFLPFNAGYFTYAPGMTNGLINDGAGLEERLLSLGPHKATPAPVPIEQVHSPVWSPRGATLAVDGAMQGTSATGVARADRPRALYLYRRNESPRMVMRDLIGVGGISWDSTGRYLAVVVAKKSGGSGLWLVDTKRGTSRFLLRDSFLAGLAWIPHTNVIAATRFSLGDGKFPSSIELIRISGQA